jgi:hypothetical protein
VIFDGSHRKCIKHADPFIVKLFPVLKIAGSS